MARVKRYWIRYNKGADRLEQQITIGTLRPNGPGWVEIDIDHCCNTIFEGQEFEETIAAVGEDEQCTFDLSINDFPIGSGILVSTPTSTADIVDQLNVFYEDVATFVLIDATTVKVTVPGISQEVTLEVDCQPIV